MYENRSPDFAFIDWIHWRPWCTVKIVGELFWITKWTDQSKFEWSMNVGYVLCFIKIGSCYCAPRLGGTDPKQLIFCIVEPGQQRIGSILLNEFLIGGVQYFDGTIVSYIFGIRVNSTDLEPQANEQNHQVNCEPQIIFIKFSTNR